MHQLFKCLLLSFGFTAVGLLANPTAEQVEFFEKNIRPALAEHCYECHNSSDKAKGGLALDWRGGLFKGSDSGQVIVAGKLDESLLLRSIRHEEKDIKMPKDGPKLSPVIIQNFESWIAMGAPDPRVKKPSREEIAKAISWETVREQRKKWWSFQPVRSPVPPRVKDDWAQTDIDKFIQAEWETEGLSPAGNAEPHALIRRLSFVLTGLPPTPEETAAFVQVAEGDRRAAVVNAVERLLASPHFGERWARHWMDWVRYAESLGSEGDPAIPNANQYRNYLIRAINADVPYDQLLREHIAGDLLPKPRLNMKLGLNESAIGPAHYRFVLQGFAPTDALDELVRTTENQIDVVSKAFLGLTVSCARCHNHKFDPISQEDYHAFYSIMTSCRPATVNIDTSARQETNKAKLAELKTRIRAALAEQWLTKTGTISEQILQPSAEWKKAIESAKDFKSPLHAWNQLRLTKGEKFTEDWKKLANAFSKSKKALDEQHARKYAKRWQFGQDTDPLNEWVLDGNGLDGTVAKAGAFRVLPSGDRIVENILPAAVYSHLLSDKHVGVLGSPSFRVEPGQSLFVRVIGGGGVMARYVVQNYTRNGTVYPVTRLNDGKWRWQSWSIKYWEGDDVHLEVTTAGEQAILARNKSKSWFGVSDVIVVQKGQLAPREEPAEFVAPLFAKGDLGNAKRLAKRYAGALRQSIRAWQRGKMTDEQANFLGYFVREGLLPNTLEELPKAANLVKEYRRLEAEVPVPQRAPGVIEAEARDRPLFVRGNHKQPAQTVPRRFLEAINAKPFATKNSGRLELAEAMLHADNPLTARVIVNRVWHHVFGRGLVATPDNFGKLGEKPSHPELLDYLAKRFVAEAWSIKKLIREIALTGTFQLAATPTAKAREMDPDNRLLTSAHVRRLEAEAIRDAMLQVSGSLDRSPLGDSDNSDSNRRSLYVRIIRNRLDPFLTVMDAPVPTSTKGRRDVTNVPAQSLTMMNDPFIVSLAERLARRVRDDESLKTVEAQISQMFQLALNRQAAVDELAGAKAFIGDAAERQKSVQSQLTEMQRQLADSKAEVTAIREPVREQLLAKRKKDGQPAVGGPEPIAAWNFSKGTEDQLGQMDLSLIGGAKIVDGALLLDGKSAFARSTPLAKSLRAKTLEAWVQLSNLDQRGGGAVSVQTRNGHTFDAIVFGERSSKRWLAGSDNHRRTESFNGPKENEAKSGPVCIAIVYHDDGKITGYRNGKLYGRTYRKAGLQSFKADDSEVVLGLRHGKGGEGARLLAGRIFKARLYDRALDSAGIMVSYQGNADYISDKQLFAAMGEEQREQLADLELEIRLLNQDLAALEKTGATVQDSWRDLAQAMFNLKEFIYLQ